MPEKEQAQKQIQAKAMEFDKGIKEMQAEWQRLGQAYVKERETLSEVMRSTKEKQIQDLQNKMQNYDQYAQQEIQKLQSELFKPIYDKAMKAIKDVAEENNFTYIFDVSSGVVLYHSNDSKDVTPLVKAKLGIQ
jgi:outer membrane protein